ncbi:MAG: hypothetical protein GYB64_06180 [Chloroflexi bacterium]|nr:hypothetical protein [Chloroflexota bacterium]
MSVVIYWNDENTLVTRFENTWSWGEYIDAAQAVAEMAADADAPAALIYDFSTSAGLPAHFFAHLPELDLLPVAENLTRIAVVCDTDSTRTARRMLRLASRGRFTVLSAATLERALAQLNREQAA